MDISWEPVIRILVAFLAGALVGIEREYNDKPAGLRTITLITVGACLYTLVSNSFDVNPERVASNIVTGIGFIGAGVMFRQGFDIKGITTAATVWMAAAVGMAIGQGLYYLAGFTVFLVMTTLVIMNEFEKRLPALRQKRLYVITFGPEVQQVDQIHERLQRFGVRFEITTLTKESGHLVASVVVAASLQTHRDISFALASEPAVKSFQV